ncbi:putative membrane protein [Bacillus glycinifermentans]|nr:putative membrane protein [Bacillus glycinifermentans]
MSLKILLLFLEKRTILVFFNFTLILKGFSFIIYNMFITMYWKKPFDAALQLQA